LRRFVVIAVALVATLAVAAVAVAQYALPVTKLTASATPTKGGTKKKPKNGQLKVSFTVNKESNVTADQIVFLLPKNAKVSGKGFRFCPATKINNEGASSCPKGSKVGRGTAQALVGPNKTAFNFAITIYAGSKSEIAMLLTGPITRALTGSIGNAGGNFGNKITVDVPPEIQQPIKGLYADITAVSATIGKAKGSTGTGKKKKTTYFVGLTGCPSDRTHDFAVRLHFAPNPNAPQQGADEAQATSACKR